MQTIKILLLGFILFLMNQNSQGQKLVFTLDTILYDFVDLGYGNEIKKVVENELTSIFISDSKLIIRKINSNHYDTFILRYENGKKFKSEILLDIEKFKEKIYVLSPSKLYYFQHQNGIFYLKNFVNLEIKNAINYEKLTYKSGYLVAYINRFIKSPIQKNHNAKVLVCDTNLNIINSSNIIDSQKDDFLGITSSYKWVCPLKEGLVYSDIGSYNLYYYDIKNKDIRKLETNKIQNSASKLECIKRLKSKYYIDPRMDILSDSLTDFEKKYSFINELISVSDSSFIVFYTLNGINNQYIDCWKMSNSEFYLINSTAILNHCDAATSNEIIQKDNFMTSWFASKKFFINSTFYNYSYFIENPYPFIGETYSNFCNKKKSSKWKPSVQIYKIQYK